MYRVRTVGNVYFRVSRIKRASSSVNRTAKRMAVRTSSLRDIMGRASGDKSINRRTIKSRRAVYPCSKEIPIVLPGKHFSTICRVNFLLLPDGGRCSRSFVPRESTDRPTDRPSPPSSFPPFLSPLHPVDRWDKLSVNG